MSGQAASDTPGDAARDGYRAPRWLRNAHAQTLYAALVAPVPRPPLRRELWDTPDGDVVALDWLAAPEGKSAAPVPLLALFHGLEGGAGSHYARALMAEVQARGWRGAVLHFRGCGGLDNRLRRAYHSGDSAEIDWMLRRLARLQGGAGPLYALGISLGGNALLKWLGEQGRQARAVVRAAAAVSAPVDLLAAGDALGRGFNRIYTRNFLLTLKRKTRRKAARHPDICDPRLLNAALTLRDFDNAVTAPLHGYRDTDDYWTRASSKPWLGRIAVPTLMLNARDDPFLPAAALPRPDQVSPCVTLDFPEQGGHVGFVTGAFPGSVGWMPRRVLGFFAGHEDGAAPDMG